MTLQGVYGLPDPVHGAFCNAVLHKSLGHHGCTAGPGKFSCWKFYSRLQETLNFMFECCAWTRVQNRTATSWNMLSYLENSSSQRNQNVVDTLFVNWGRRGQSILSRSLATELRPRFGTIVCPITSGAKPRQHRLYNSSILLIPNTRSISIRKSVTKTE